jgi:hypothetical protein
VASFLAKYQLMPFTKTMKIVKIQMATTMSSLKGRKLGLSLKESRMK